MSAHWIKNAAIYQIYPQSYQDSNGDGVGDFQGIIQRLDYIKSLGVNTIWMNPCFDSPFGDAGYDVRNFYEPASRYGTKEDLVQLFEQTHKLDLKVILDLVAGHTSMDHPWFVAESNDPANPESNRYIWKNRNFDPKAGPEKSDFVSNFFWHQPALNYGYGTPLEPWQDFVDAPGPLKNRKELRNILSYWFELGCDGFRVDMAASLIKKDSKENPQIRQLWHEIRAWMDERYPDCALLAEWSNPTDAIAAGFDIDFMMHFNAPGYPSLFFNGAGTLANNPDNPPCYFSPQGKGKIEEFRDEYSRQLQLTKGKGFISLPTANHDFQRPRVGERGWNGLRPLWVFLMTQAGIPTIYYGDEIGMRFVEEAPAKEGSTLHGVIAANAGSSASGERAGSRTPMQWDDSENAGFSTASADELYLPLDDDSDRPTVESQQNDPDSLLNFVRKLLIIRSEHPALATDGSYEIVNENRQPYPLVIRRELGGKAYCIIVNPSAQEQEISVKERASSSVELLNSGVRVIRSEDALAITAPAYSYAIFLWQ